MSEKKPFVFEFAVYNFIATLIEFLGELMESLKWTMSPSRFYRIIGGVITWCREKNLWHFNQPAFLYVIEQCNERSKTLRETHDDESRKMEMAVWRDRKPPIPGGHLSVLQIFDWFLPILRALEANMVRYFGNPDENTNGNEFTPYEAWDTVFMVIDKLYKDPHFGEMNSWGQPKAYPWMDFVRDEMYEMREVLKPNAPPPPAGYEPPFSTP